MMKVMVVMVVAVTSWVASERGNDPLHPPHCLLLVPQTKIAKQVSRVLLREEPQDSKPILNCHEYNVLVKQKLRVGQGGRIPTCEAACMDPKHYRFQIRLPNVLNICDGSENIEEEAIFLVSRSM